MPASQPVLPPIAQVIETLSMGGAEHLAVRFANELAARGERSHLVVIEKSGPLRAKVAPGVSVHELNHARGSIRHPIAFLASLRRGRRRLAGLVRDTGIGVMQTHLPGANFWGLLIQRAGVCPVIATIHNNREFEYGDADNPLRRFLRMRAYRDIIARCAFTVAVSEDVRTSMLEQLGLSEDRAPRLRTVTNGVSPPAPLDPTARASIRERHRAPDAVPLIVAAGRLGPQKNHADLIAAAALLRDRGLAFRLVIAGEGELRQELTGLVEQHRLADRVELPGNLDDLDRLLAAADLFAMASRWEGLPLVLLEAMAAGLPPVAYAIKGVSDVLTHESVGVPVPPGDVVALADAIAGLLADREARRRMGDAAREHVARHFSFGGTVDRLVTLYAAAASPGVEN